MKKREKQETWKGSEFPTLSEGRKVEQMSDRAMIDRTVILLPVIFTMTAMDGFVLYSVMDRAMMQSAVLGVLTSIGIALILNFLPLLTARFVKTAIYRVQRHAAWFALISVAAFLTIYLSTVYLRFSYQDMYGDDLGVALLNTMQRAVDQTNSVDSGKEGKSLATVLLLSLEPLATSLLNFLLAIVTDDPIKKKKDFLSRRELELDGQQSNLEGQIESLRSAKDFLLESDEKQYQAARQILISRANELRSLGLSLLTEHLHNPSAASRLSFEAMRKLADSEEPDVSDRSRDLRRKDGLEVLEIPTIIQKRAT